jgi:hypothetical protein
MKVKELIELLRQQDENLEVGIEGCDCTASADGVSVEGGILYIRRHDGVLKHQPMTKRERA